MSPIRLDRPFIVLSALLAFSFGVFPQVCEGKARPSTGSGTAASDPKEPDPKPTPLAEPSVLVTDNHPALLDEEGSVFGWLSSSVWSKLRRVPPADEYLWTCISLHSKNSFDPNVKPANVTISASGLGGAAFAVLEGNPCPGANKAEDGPTQRCKIFSGPGGGWTKDFGCWQSVLTVPLEQQPKLIGVRIPAGLVQQAGNSIEGKITFDEALHKPLEVPLKIERPPDPINTGLQWFLGIAVPAVLSFIIGYVVLKTNTRVSSRSEQVNAFNTFKDESYDVLDTFFTVFYPAAYQANPRDAKIVFGALRKEMRNQKILKSIPQKERKLLERAMNLFEEEQFHASLIVLFKEWQGSIESKKIEK
jgi:hypothetical protein